MHLFVSFVSGMIFALGLGISGMTNPGKIIGFLDILGPWDPSLLFVMVGAIAVHALSYWKLDRIKAPVLQPRYELPIKTLSRKVLSWVHYYLELVGGYLVFVLGQAWSVYYLETSRA